MAPLILGVTGYRHPDQMNVWIQIHTHLYKAFVVDMSRQPLVNFDLNEFDEHGFQIVFAISPYA